ncbi:MAG: APC family permease [Bacteroidia bacterium]|nr:APC family permease [Bacteroidia bacterium]MDW8134394.1 APC family permease [Bacteroidia bacterium]
MHSSRFGWLSATFLVIANMVGTGIYTTTGFIVRETPEGLGVLLLWGLGGIAALGGAKAYAELAKRHPRSGGEYHFLSVLYHPAVGYLAGLVSLVAGFAAPIAASAYAFSAYIPLSLTEFERKILGVGLIGVLAGVHSLGLSRGAQIQNFFVLIKISLLLTLIVGAIISAPSDAQELTFPPISGKTLRTAAVSLIFISFAYSGWNAAAYIMSEIPKAAHVVPRAILSGTLIVMTMYLAFNYVLLRYIPAKELAGQIAVGKLLASKLWGEKGNIIFGWGVSLTMVSSVSAMLMIAPRVLSVMGEDYPQLRVLAKRNRWGGPLPAIILVASLATLFLFLAAFDAIMNYIGFTLSLSAGLTVMGLFLRHGRNKKLPWVLGILFLILTAWMVTNNLWERPWESGAGMLTLLAVGTSYLWLKR